MKEADRIAARKAAAQRALENAGETRALGKAFDEHRELASRLRRAVPKALAAEKRRSYEGVVQVHGTVRGWAPPWEWWEGGLFRSTDKHFGAYELLRTEVPLPHDSRVMRRVTVYLTTAGDLAYSNERDLAGAIVIVRSVSEYLDVFGKDLARRAAWHQTPPRPGQWLREDSDRHLPKEVRDEMSCWKDIGLRKVVEAVERLGGGR
jgi:hypothetical protein